MHEVVHKVFLLRTNDELQFRYKHFEKVQTRRLPRKLLLFCTNELLAKFPNKHGPKTNG